VATWQALQNNPQVLKSAGIIIIDECHGAAAQVLGQLLNDHAAHCAYRYGCTGTIPKPKLDEYTIRGSLGRVLFTITAAELIEQGYLSELEIEPIETQDDVAEDFPDYASERAYLDRSGDRLDLIADLVITKAAKYGNTLVLVNSIKQGKALQKLISDSVFLYGETENDVRAEWYGVFAERDDLIVIATYGIASTGLSIDRIFNLMLVDAGKSFIRCIQTIGRGLRKNGDKVKVHVTDVFSKLKWSKKHFSARKKFYTEATYPLTKVAKLKP
jgi:superfamily II DNA or RNA helicase